MGRVSRWLFRAAGRGAIAVAGGWFLLAVVADSRPARPVVSFFNPPVRNLAHRGGSLLAPEETLAAFAAAVRHDVDALEMDVHLSRDGELVVFHDRTLDRTTDGSGEVAGRSLAELRELNAGHRFRDREGRFAYRDDPVGIPTLTEVFAAHPGQRMVIEMKAAAAAAPLCEMIQRAGKSGEVLVGAFEQAALDVFRELCPDVPTGAGFTEAAGFWGLSLLGLEGLFRAPADALLVSEGIGAIRVVTPRFLRAARRVRLPVIVWTVNRAEDMNRLLDLGVDGILTDDPAALSDVLASRR